MATLDFFGHTRDGNNNGLPFQSPQKRQEKDRSLMSDPPPPLVEVMGVKKMDAEAKVATARTPRAPAVNNHGGLGLWNFIEIGDSWTASTTITGRFSQC